MSVSNLTNTKWVIKEYPTISSYTTYSINFTSSQSNYSSFAMGNMLYGYLQYDNNDVYFAERQGEPNWYNNEQHRIIEITGGTDVTNSSLISWLEANAVQVNVTDLTGTKWVLNSNLGTTTPNGTQYNYGIGHFFSESYSFNFVSANTNFSAFVFRGTGEGGGTLLNYYSSNDADVCELTSMIWDDEAYRIISITNGTDVSNPDLLVWLNNNATLVPVVDLSGTTWEINDETISNWETPAINTTFDFNGIVNSSLQCDGLLICNNQRPFGNDVGFVNNGSFVLQIINASTVENVLPCTISIVDGTDIANPDLIAWLSQNATLQQTPVKTFDLSTLQLSAGTHTIQVRARATGYRDSNFSNSLSYEAGKWSCVVAGLGSENPSNVTFTHTGTMPTFEEVTVNSNVFIKIPKMYRKVLATSDNQITSFEIANYKKDNSFVPYTCFVKEDGTTEMDYVLIGKYYSNSSSVMNSVNTSSATQTITNARTNARALGSGYQLYDWQIQKLWQDLIICKKNTINTNSGSGIGTNGYDDFGIYWGTINAPHIDGVMGNSGNWNFSYKPSEYASETVPSSYIQASYSRPTYTASTPWHTETRKLGYDISNPFFNYPSGATSNSNHNTYYCDGCYYASGVLPVMSSIGGLGADRGAFFYGTSSSWTNAREVRLCYRPIDGSTN